MAGFGFLMQTRTKGRALNRTIYTLPIILYCPQCLVMVKFHVLPWVGSKMIPVPTPTITGVRPQSCAHLRAAVYIYFGILTGVPKVSVISYH